MTPTHTILILYFSHTVRRTAVATTAHTSAVQIDDLVCDFLRFLYVVVQSKKVTGLASKIGPPKRGAIVNMCKRLHDQCVLYRSNDESIERRTTVSTSKKEGVRVSFSFGWRLKSVRYIRRLGMISDKGRKNIYFGASYCTS